MENKNLIIALVVVVVLFAGFLGYRHFKGKKDLQAHHEDTYKRLTEVAQKSPRGGLLEMGMALQRYYADNSAYPAGLGDLYPKYIGSRSFIDDVNWEYAPESNNFLLTKRVTLGGQILTASVDKSLKGDQASGRRVAMAARRPTQPKPEAITPVPDIDLLADLAVTAPKPEAVEIPYTVDTKVEPRVVSVDKTQSPSHFIAQLSNKYLVWSDRNGNLGFGNVEYPSAEQFSMATPDNWLNVKKRMPEVKESAFQKIMTSKDKTDAALIAADFSKTLLVWKDNSGIVGFGNVEYPTADRFSVATPDTDEWVLVERPMPREKDAMAQEIMTSTGETDVGRIAFGFSKNLLVWKDKNGMVGFGNVDYPTADQLSVATPDEWVPVERRLPKEKVSAPQEIVTSKSETDMEHIASGFGGNLLVWKDKSGAVGFGNVEYPEANDIAYVNVEGAWHQTAR